MADKSRFVIVTYQGFRGRAAITPDPHSGLLVRGRGTTSFVTTMIPRPNLMLCSKPKGLSGRFRVCASSPIVVVGMRPSVRSDLARFRQLDHSHRRLVAPRSA